MPVAASVVTQPPCGDGRDGDTQAIFPLFTGARTMTGPWVVRVVVPQAADVSATRISALTKTDRQAARSMRALIGADDRFIGLLLAFWTHDMLARSFLLTRRI